MYTKIWLVLFSMQKMQRELRICQSTFDNLPYVIREKKTNIS